MVNIPRESFNENIPKPEVKGNGGIGFCPLVADYCKEFESISKPECGY
jgi:hypothetical protein